jgi:hypothetical protein
MSAAVGTSSKPVEVLSPSCTPPEVVAAYEAVYTEARGDAARVPWAKSRPHPAMVAWLNADAPGLLRPGARAAVVGCGLGDDVAELCARGHDAVGFDISPTAVRWARERFGAIASAFLVADALNPPSRLRHRFDLVTEVATLQSVPPELRQSLLNGVSQLVGRSGHVLIVCREREESEPLGEVKGPPWPLTRTELLALAERSGLKPERPLESTAEASLAGKRYLRGLFVRAC